MKRNSSGFTLAEIAIVLVIVGLLMGGLLQTLSTQLDQRKRNDTQQTLDLARDTLIGYAIANGRLPCPAAPNATGTEVAAGGVCTYQYNGFYPGTTVGIAPVDAQGYLLDAWNNRIRYAVTTVQSNIFATTITANQIKSVGIPNIIPPTTSPYLYVCNSASGVIAGPSCTTSTTLTYGAAAVIYSLGKNGAPGGNGGSVGSGADESKNLDNDRVFISHDPTDSTAANGEFDDIVTWLSPNVLYNRLIAAGAI